MPPKDLPSRVLVVTAHPDDVDFGASGTVASWTASGVEVAYCIVTDGAAGALEPTTDIESLAAVREAEQRKAAAVVGVEDVTFLGYSDGHLAVTAEVRRDIARVIRRVAPDRVLCQCPERNWDRIHSSHPDHLAAGEATLDAVYPDARNPFAYPELLAAGFEPHVVSEVWMMAAPGGGNEVVDITATIDSKIAALRCHHSQVGDGGDLEERIRTWSAATAEAMGLPTGRFAEVFRAVDTR